MTGREQVIEVAPEVELSPLEAKADRRRRRVRKIILDTRLQAMEKAFNPKRTNRGDK